MKLAALLTTILLGLHLCTGCVTISALYDSNGDPATPPPTVNKWCEKITGKKIACINHSLGGGSATGCANSMEAKFSQALTDGSTAIVIGLGTNDLGPWPTCVGTTPEDVVLALANFAARGAVAGKVVWIATILRVNNTTDQWAIDWNAQIDATNALIREMFDHVIEVHDAISSPSEFRADFVHLTDTGEQHLADVIRGAI